MISQPSQCLFVTNTNNGKWKPMISKMKQLRINQWTLVLAACGIVGLATVAQADSVTNAPSASTVPAATNAPAATAVAPASQPYGKKASVGFSAGG